MVTTTDRPLVPAIGSSSHYPLCTAHRLAAQAGHMAVPLSATFALLVLGASSGAVFAQATSQPNAGDAEEASPVALAQAAPPSRVAAARRQTPEELFAERYRDATEHNNIGAMFALGLMYEEGLGVSKDEAEAARWYRRAAEGGHTRAMYQLGLIYLSGKGVPLDDAEAVIWFRRAADLDNADAVNALGFMYERGRGVYNDDAEAVRLYRKGAELNQPEAMYNLGLMYASGRGVTKDMAEAVAWYQKAADRGIGPAMYSLGRAYQEGLGAENDPSAAADWIVKALKAHDAVTVKEMTTNADAWGKEFRRELQRRMHEAGAYDGKIDGKFGEGTKRAIEALAKQ